MRPDQDAAQTERVSLAYRRLANAMILSTLREISKNGDAEVPEVTFVESRRIDAWALFPSCSDGCRTQRRALSCL